MKVEEVREGSNLFRNFSIVHRFAKVYISGELKRLGIENCHPPHIVMISAHKGISQEELAAKLRIDKGAIAKTISQMIKDGYVTKEQSSKDKRRYNLYLTQKGEEIVPKLAKLQASFEEILTEGMTEAEVEALTSLLDKASKNISAGTGKEKEGFANGQNT
ncbi:MAG: MarR family winged helix-turn-helix transcriptional regulator [Anaerovoracaceae bacterium]